ncbi:MAG: riboflavin biosynthesis protein RibF [Endomicrobiia bacterium]
MQKGIVLTIGFFDGVHIGHKKLINYVIDYAGKNDFEPEVITFDKVSKIQQGLIFPLKQKIEKIKTLGIKKIDVLKFDIIRKFSPEKFFEEILLPKRTKAVIIGQDFCFGYKRKGSVKILKQLCEKNNIVLIVIKDVSIKINNVIKKISSTIIRRSIVDGKYGLAEKLLGDKYFISGNIVRGYGIGRKLGVPTINFFPEQELVLPRGIVAGECMLGKNTYPAIADIGYIPTIKDLDKIICEVHILSKSFKHSKYNKKIYFRPINKIREEKKFKDIVLLKKYMYNDILLAKKILKKNFGGNYAS